MQGLNKAPKISLFVEGHSVSAQLNVLPDSGANISAADEFVLTKLGEHIDNLLPPNQHQEYSIGGSILQLIGQTNFKITLGDVTIENTLHLSEDSMGVC